MKIAIVNFIIIIILFGCSRQPEVSNDSLFQLDTISPKIFIKNRNLYSEDFLNNLWRDIENDSICMSLKLIDGLIIYNSDTLVFPEQIKIGKIYYLTGEEKGISYKLMLTRINKTDLKYYYFVDNKPTYKFKGNDVALHLYPSIIKNRNRNYFGDDGLASDYLGYSNPNDEDSSFYIFLKTNKDGKFEAVFREICWLLRPTYLKVSPTMVEQ